MSCKQFEYDYYRDGEFVMRGTVKQIAQQVGRSIPTVGQWRYRPPKGVRVVRKAEQATNRPTSQSDALKPGETAENDASKCEIYDFDDSREKLEADIKKYRWEHGETSGRVTEWLDRQAAITAREWCHTIDGLSDENDELRALISERYMELPVDADGVPIHVGDEMIYTDPDGLQFKCIVPPLTTYEPTCYRHVKPRTLMDVLGDFADIPERIDRIAAVNRYADEIRDLFGGKGANDA